MIMAHQLIRAEFTGSTEVNVTAFTINGEDADGEVEDNQLTYTLIQYWVTANILLLLK